MTDHPTPTTSPTPPTSSPRRWGAKQTAYPLRDKIWLGLRLGSIAGPELRRIAQVTVLAIVTLISPPTLAEPADAILPIWREIFARSATNLTALPAPPDSQLTPAKVRLGKLLFFDTRLSGDNARSCATCHNPDRAFTDARKHAEARDGTASLPNTPTLFNLAWAKRLFWDGRAQTLEQQARIPIEHPQEMAGSWPQITARLSGDRSFQAAFQEAFPETGKITPETILAALASYERTLVSPITRFDRFIAGDQTALTSLEQLGLTIFVGKAGCVGCHSGWRFTDDRLHTVPLAGTQDQQTTVKKTPGLRAVSKTAPYMHNGTLKSLETVIEHYLLKSDRRAQLSPNLVQPLNLSNKEQFALISFLKAIDSRE